MKKILVMAFAVVSAAVAQASYLYWQTGTGTSFNGHNIYGYSMVATDGTTTTYLTPTYTDGSAVTALKTNVYGSDSEYKILLDEGTYSNYSFYVEYVGYDSAAFGQGNAGVIAVGETMSYAALVTNGHIVPAGLTTIPTAWTGGTASAPEPSSAVLMLIGLAGLALKRRNV